MARARIRTVNATGGDVSRTYNKPAAPRRPNQKPTGYENAHTLSKNDTAVYTKGNTYKGAAGVRINAKSVNALGDASAAYSQKPRRGQTQVLSKNVSGFPAGRATGANTNQIGKLGKPRNVASKTGLVMGSVATSKRPAATSGKVGLIQGPEPAGARGPAVRPAIGLQMGKY